MSVFKCFPELKLQLYSVACLDCYTLGEANTFCILPLLLLEHIFLIYKIKDHAMTAYSTLCIS